jgi:hypothetical protein
MGYLILTTTEGGKGEWDNRAHIWLTTDLEKGSWKDYKSYQKDSMPFIFGFGRIFFGASLNNKIYLSGSSLEKIDDNSLVISLSKTKGGHTNENSSI